MDWVEFEDERGGKIYLNLANIIGITGEGDQTIVYCAAETNHTKEYGYQIVLQGSYDDNKRRIDDYVKNRRS